MSDISTVKQYFDTLGDRFDYEAAKGMNASFQFELTGDGGGVYCVNVNDGDMNIAEGEQEEPSLTITISADNYLKLAHGKLNGQMAVMTGKMKVKGNMGLAMKMQKLFPVIKN
jgi:putative sterol carrier protein